MNEHVFEVLVQALKDKQYWKERARAVEQRLDDVCRENNLLKGRRPLTAAEIGTINGEIPHAWSVWCPCPRCKLP